MLYRFGTKSRDGVYPYSGLIDLNSTLYGATYHGGGSGCYYRTGLEGCGTVYSVSTSRAEKVLYRFASGSDGANPYAGLVSVSGTLYGTTPFGGGGTCQFRSGSSGCGAVYSITTAGAETVLHAFSGGSDGANLYNEGLIDVGGTLYGTTFYGGWECREVHCGTVFGLTP